MTLLKKNLFTLGFASLGFSLVLILLFIVFFSSPVLLVILLILYFAAVLFAVYKFSYSLSFSFGRLVKIVLAGASILPDSKLEEMQPQDFRSLEKTMKVIMLEVNQRFQQAKSESSRLEAILNGMSEAVFAMDSSLKLHLVNPKARELFNLGSHDVSAMTLLEATRSTELLEIAKKAVSGGVSLETELTFHFGAEKFFLVYASPLNKSDGAVLVLQEITKLVKLERIRKDFVANVSHELRTPIHLIKGFSESLLDVVSSSGQDEKSQIIHFVEIIRKNADNMENLTNDLLMLSNLENDTITRETNEENIAFIIAEAVYSVEPQAKKKQIEIIVKCPEDISAKLYGSFIIQALINLLDNGIKYSPPKSKLWISAFLNQEELVFEVRDKGIGISSEHLERIFERFYRVDRARSRDEGTGLGLSIVRHIALLHKGNAEVESHAGEGSIFRITIPFIQCQLTQ